MSLIRRTSPDDSFTSWTTYTLPFGLELGGGVRYVSGLHRGTDGAVGTPKDTDGYVVADAIVSYALTDNIKLRINAYNLFDKDYIAAINKSGYRYSAKSIRSERDVREEIFRIGSQRIRASRKPQPSSRHRYHHRRRRAGYQARYRAR